MSATARRSDMGQIAIDRGEMGLSRATCRVDSLTLEKLTFSDGLADLAVGFFLGGGKLMMRCSLGKAPIRTFGDGVWGGGGGNRKSLI